MGSQEVDCLVLEVICLREVLEQTPLLRSPAKPFSRKLAWHQIVDADKHAQKAELLRGFCWSY